MDQESTEHPAPRQAALAVVTHLRAQGHEAYFAGGCVRDELLGLDPGDYDVATDATPDRLASLFHGSRLVGAKFGVVQVRKLGIWTEVATFRTDGSYSDRRRPDGVTFSDSQSDAERRDFTINALFLDPLADREDWTPRPDAAPIAGRVIDLVGGLTDLQRGVLRAVGDAHQRLAEDQLRALRAVRFAARLGFEIDPTTAHAITEHAGELEGISRERIGGELRRMLSHESRARAAAIMEMLGLDGPVLEERARGAGQHHPRLAALERTAETATALAAWSAERGHGGTEEDIAHAARRLRAALCLSNEEQTMLSAILSRRLDVIERFAHMGKAGQKRLASARGFTDALTLVRAERGEIAAQVDARVAELAAEHGGQAPAPWVPGEVLIGLGWMPGPEFERVLED
ncbi:MAG: CCA tRNA nucleotidyltransferase, partial [Phycisphaerales bacterium]